MNKIIRRLLLSASVFVAILLVYAYIYMVGADAFEGDSVPYYVALQTTVESITTAGFGGQAPWESMEMNILVIVMNLTGVAIFFFGIPLAVAPIARPRLEQVLDNDPPRKTGVEEHVILAGYTDIDQKLIGWLDESEIQYVLVGQLPQPTSLGRTLAQVEDGACVTSGKTCSSPPSDFCTSEVSWQRQFNYL